MAVFQYFLIPFAVLSLFALFSCPAGLVLGIRISPIETLITGHSSNITVTCLCLMLSVSRRCRCVPFRRRATRPLRRRTRTRTDTSTSCHVSPRHGAKAWFNLWERAVLACMFPFQNLWRMRNRASIARLGSVWPNSLNRALVCHTTLPGTDFKWATCNIYIFF